MLVKNKNTSIFSFLALYIILNAFHTCSTPVAVVPVRLEVVLNLQGTFLRIRRIEKRVEIAFLTKFLHVSRDFDPVLNACK